jgi:hypothetical protein
MHTFIDSIIDTHDELPQVSEAPINHDKRELSTGLTVLCKPKKVQ